MNKKQRTYVALSVIIIVFGLLIASYPRERLVLHNNYTPLEFYSTYYDTNFTVASSDTNAELSFDLNLDFGDNYTSCTTVWILYQLPPEQFAESFNLTEVRDAMMSEDWDVEDFGAFWAGWFIDSSFNPFWEPVTPGAYVFVFWVEPHGPTIGWSATLTVSLRTSLLSIL